MSMSTGYNIGLQGIKAKWPLEHLSILFDLLARLASLAPATSDQDAEPLRREISCRFTSLSARMESLGSAPPEQKLAVSLLMCNR